MSRPCIICWRQCPTGNTDNRKKKAEILKRFCKLFRRYINDDNGKPDGTNDDEKNAKRLTLFERAINAGLLSCEECSKLVESFCELYKEMKSIELLLNWKATTLMNVMSSAQRVPSRLKDFKESVKKLLDVSDVSPDEMVDFKKGLVRTCKRKLRVRDTYPRLVLKKYSPSSENVRKAGPTPSPPAKANVFFDVCKREISVSQSVEEAGDSILTPIMDISSEAPVVNSSPAQADQGLTKESLEASGNDNGHVGAPTNTAGDKPAGIPVETSSSNDDDHAGHSPQHFSLESQPPPPKVVTTCSKSLQTNRIPPDSIISPKSGKHKCAKCSREFNDRWNYARHYRSVHLKVRYQCTICGSRFCRRDDYNSHFQRVHMGVKENWQCHGRGATFQNKVSFRLHHKRSAKCGKSLKPKPIILKCHICGREFRRPSYLRKHLLKDGHQEKPSCQTPSQEKNSDRLNPAASSSRNNAEEETTDPRQAARPANDEAAQVENLEQSIDVGGTDSEDSESEYYNDAEANVEAGDGTLAADTLPNEDIPPPPPKLIKSKHFREVYLGMPPRVRVTCDKCGLSFVNKQWLERHREKTQCGKEIPGTSNAATTTEDANEDTHQLTIIKGELTSSESSQWKRRIPTSIYNPQSGEHQCRKCPKKFYSLKGYGHHYRSIHLRVRYRCSKCPKIFIRRQGYSAHFKRVHMGGANLESSTHQSSLRKDQKTNDCVGKIPKSVQKCHICGEGFQQLHHFLKHLKETHASNNNEGQVGPLLKMEAKCGNVEFDADRIDSDVEGETTQVEQKVNVGDMLAECSGVKNNVPSYENADDDDNGMAATETAPAKDNNPRPSPKSLSSLETLQGESIPLRFAFNPDSRKYKCSKCSREYRQLHDVKQHYRKCHQVRYRCTFCKKIFTLRPDYNSHFKEEHMGNSGVEEVAEPEPFLRDRPPPAPKVVGSPKNRQVPSSDIDPKSGKHKCFKCPREFCSRNGFRRHYMSIHLKLRYGCPACPKTFAHRDYYYEHFKSAHNRSASDRVVKCQGCDKSFKFESSLRKHLQWSACGRNPKSGSRIVQNCHICGKGFQQLYHFFKHLKAVHGQEDKQAGAELLTLKQKSGLIAQEWVGSKQDLEVSEIHENGLEIRQDPTNMVEEREPPTINEDDSGNSDNGESLSANPGRDSLLLVTDARDPILVPSGRRSLRTVHRCSTCSRTFSSDTRLAQHQKTECIDPTAPSKNFDDLVEENSDSGEDEDDDDCGGSSSEGSNYGEEWDDDNESDVLDDDDDHDMGEALAEETEKNVFEFEADQSNVEEELEQVEQKVNVTAVKDSLDVVGSGQMSEEVEKDEGNKKKSWPCKECKKTFGSKLLLSRHETIYHSVEWKHNHHNPRKKNGKASQIQHGFKCPDCDKLFPELHLMLLHRTKYHKKPDTPDGGTFIDVQIFSFLKKASRSLSVKDKSKFKQFATVEVASTVFLCHVRHCGEPFYSSEDLQIHSKLHGQFKCNYCDVTKGYAPDLAEHELVEHARKPEKEPNGKRVTYFCARCEAPFQNNGKSAHLRHHLNAHLSLSISGGACAICRTHGFLLRNAAGNKGRLFHHYKTCHDKGANSKSAELSKCPMEKCSAYFVGSRLLASHLEKYHENDEKGWMDELKKTLQTCKSCGKQFKSRGGFQAHQDNGLCRPDDGDVKDRKTLVRLAARHRFKCPEECSETFGHVHQLLSHHQQAHPQPSPLVGDDEPQIITVDIVGSVSELIARVKVPAALFTCPERDCQRGFYQAEDLDTHSKLHGSFPCGFCDVVKTFAPELAEHEMEHSGPGGGGTPTTSQKQEGSNYCPRCKHSCGYKEGYIRHHLEKHLKLPFSRERCAICKANQYSATRLLNYHYETAHNLNTVGDDEQLIQQCGIGDCPAYFVVRVKKMLTLHHRSFHGLDDDQVKELKRKRRHKSLVCKDCGKGYSKRDDLRSHRVKIHLTKDNSYPCTSGQDCGRIFETEAELEKHTKSHTKVTECPKCKKMIGSGGFHRHMSSHQRKEDIEAGVIIPKKLSKERPHVCDMCGKAFKEKGQLERHYLAHSGPSSWNFQCGVCSKKCLSQGKLKEHMRTHTKEKPFVCDLCGEKYAHRHNLRIHVNSKHGDVTQDIPMKRDTTNLTSRKGIKRKKTEKVVESSSEESE